MTRPCAILALGFAAVSFQAAAAIAIFESAGIEFVAIPAGTFEMGSDDGDWDEAPVRSTEITQPYLISVREIRLEQYRRFRPEHRHAAPTGAVTAVSWYDAAAFCEWLSAQEGRPYRLPTEAEWEHACRRNGGGPGDQGAPIPVAEGIDVQFDGFKCHVYSRAYPAGEIVLGGNDRSRTKSPGTFIAVIVAESAGAQIEVMRHPGTQEYALLAAEPGVKPYADRDYAISALDDRLRGGRLVQTYVSDEEVAGEDYLVLESSDAVTVYLIFNADTEYLPAWMSGYTAHGDDSGRRPLLAPQTSGALDLIGMCDETPEWCMDWYGPYGDLPESDPVGPEHGMARVVRGNMLDVHTRFILPHKRGYYYQRASNRAGMAPGFAPRNEVNDFGTHRIGFRIVQAPIPSTHPNPTAIAPVMKAVKQGTTTAAREHGPDPEKPYFRKRHLLPTPPETIEGFKTPEMVAQHTRAIDALALHPAFGGHNHSPALEVMPNGDLLLVIFTSWNEYEPDMALMATRLRIGADHWDMPSILIDMPDACDNTPLLWTDGDIVRIFWANTNAHGAYPFQWIESRDSGATWSDVHFPNFTTPVGPHSRQPINTVVRDNNGAVYVPSDGIGASSTLWVTRDNFLSWEDPGGRTGGRHTTFVLLKDDAILGMGGKSSDIEGYMPQSISRDGGKTWEVTKTVFAALGSNQRPCVLRLARGRLFFCGDFQRIDGAAPAGVTERGSYVALSDDDGGSWHVKKLIGTQPHENPKLLGGADTIGYSVARQAPDGLIHIVTTMNTPCLHFALNEAWVLAPSDDERDEAALMANSATDISNVEQYEERYDSGTPRIIWHAGIGNDGRYLLHSQEKHYRDDGTVEYEVAWERGEKRGQEVWFDVAGKPLSQWRHAGDGTSDWTQWWPNGQRKAQSHWQAQHADGQAQRWDGSGTNTSDVRFRMGNIVE